MAQWGKTDNYQNSVLWAVAGFNKTANTGAGSNQQAFYNSVTPNAFITGETIGQFGVDTTEAGVGSANIAQVTITSAGTGYGATINSVITGGGGTGANVSFTSTVGKLTSSTINNGGSSYETNPTITIPAPPSTTFNANSAVTGGTGGGANSTIALSSAANFANNDAINYLVATGNTAVGGLTSGTKYYVQFANATVIALSTVPGGSRITLTKGFTETGHSFFGETAAASAVVGGASNKGVAHAGWVVRRVGSGGRAGRVQYETLVAMGTITSDGSDDTILPDS